jgi:hypothetical protein
MFPRLLPVVVVLAMSALSVSALSIGLMPHEPRLWRASIALVALGALTPLIYAVNARIVPVFSRRNWQTPRLLALAMLVASLSGWTTFAGRAGAHSALELAGALFALAGALLFVTSLVHLFRSPVASPVPPPLPYPGHEAIDRIAIRFTRASGTYLLLGTTLGVVLNVWSLPSGRWELVWAHALLLGWFVQMVSGVIYHVLARWTGHRWRHPRLIGLHWQANALALPLMLVALAIDHRWLLALAGSLQATALLLFIYNALPMVAGLPPLSRVPLTAAFLLLGLGVLIGASFALDPVNHVRLRFSHGVVNMLGFGGLLISGCGYYLFPRFAGQPLRWPRIAAVQVALQFSGAMTLAVALWWYMRGGEHANAFALYGGAATAIAILLFIGTIAATFACSRRNTTVSPIRITPPLAVRRTTHQS